MQQEQNHASQENSEAAVFRLQEALLSSRRWKTPNQSAQHLIGELADRAFPVEGNAQLLKYKTHREVFSVGIGQTPAVIKMFHAKRLWQRLLLLLFPYTAWREYRILRYLFDRSVPVAQPIGCAVYGESLLPQGSLLVLNELNHTGTLGDALRREAAGESPLRSELLGAYGRILAQINRYSFFVDDAHAENFLVRIESGALKDCWSIDHEATRPFAGRLEHWRKKNLMAAIHSTINPEFSSADSAQILRSYCQELRGAVPADREISQLQAELQNRSLHTEARREKKRQKKAAALGIVCCVFAVVLLTGCTKNRRSGFADQAPPPEPVELAPFMTQMQRFSQKLGLSIKAKNQMLALFYIHELRETFDEILAVEEDNGIPIAQPGRVILPPLLTELSDSIVAADWDNSTARFANMIEGCNRCHTATENEIIVITPDVSSNPFNQDFSLPGAF